MKNTTQFLNYSLFSDSLENLSSNAPLLINTINQYSFCIAEKDEVFRHALENSDVLLPDGIAITMATKFLTGQKIKKIAGADLHRFLLEDLNQKSGSCFYLGSSNSTLNKIKEKMAVEFPNVTVGIFSPAYKANFTEFDNKEMLAAVNFAKPDVLFVGMTAPKQEKWTTEHKNLLETKIIGTIGAVFDFYAGTIERPSPIWINLGLEWFVRLIKEPRRMWRRYLYYGPVFLYSIVKEKFVKN